MAQTKLLVDTSSYFRLAQNVHPLLGVPFGKPAYTLYAHADLTAEFKREPRFHSKFDWFTQRPYADNRSRPLNVGHKQRAEIELAYGYMAEQARTAGIGVSPVDLRILATASVLALTLVSDDGGLLEMAEEYEVRAMTSLELLRLMVDEKHIDTAKVQQVVAQWQYDNDVPGNFRSEYRRLFGTSPPKE